jgi:type IV fimbrial biogenesis protein FimT
MKKAPSQVNACQARHRSGGFTLIELMLGISVLGILLGIGVPAYQGMIRQNRLAAQTNELLATAAMARSEAVKRGSTVSICPAATDGSNACSGDASWSNGWILFNDDDGDGVYDGGVELILQRWPTSAERRMTITNAGRTSLTYRGDGGTTLGAGVTTTFLVAPESGYCNNAQGARNVTVTATGRVNAVKRNCP